MIKKISYERRVYESVDDNSLSKAISQKNDEKNKSCNKGLTAPPPSPPTHIATSYFETITQFEKKTIVCLF